MPTKFTSLNVAGAMTIGGALSLAAATLTGVLTFTTATGTSIDLSGTGEAQILSGASLLSGTGITITDNDGAGCTHIGALNGTVAAYTVTCP